MSSTILEQAQSGEIRYWYTDAAEGALLSSNPAINACRQAALERFQLSQWPTRQHERYRYFPWHNFFQRRYTEKLESTSMNEALVLDSPSDAISVVMLDGELQPMLSDLAELPEGIHVTAVADLNEQQAELYAQALSRANLDDRPFLQMNIALANNGVLVEVDKEVTCDRPLQLVHLASESLTNSQHHTQNIIAVGERAKITVLEDYVSQSTGDYLHTVYTQMHVGRNADVRCYQFQRESRQSVHVSNTQVFQSADSNIDVRLYSFGAELSRAEKDVFFTGSGARCSYKALLYGRGQQQQACYTLMSHQEKQNESHQDIRALAADQSQITVDGHILVGENCASTVAHLHNRNVLLGERAVINTKPALVIDNDDVMCSHGATIGQLDSAALFYLQSRGVPEVEARNVLLSSMVHSLIDDISDSLLREYVERGLVDQGILTEGI